MTTRARSSSEPPVADFFANFPSPSISLTTPNGANANVTNTNATQNGNAPAHLVRQKFDPFAELLKPANTTVSISSGVGAGPKIPSFATSKVPLAAMPSSVPTVMTNNTQFNPFAIPQGGSTVFTSEAFNFANFPAQNSTLAPPVTSNSNSASSSPIGITTSQVLAPEDLDFFGSAGFLSPGDGHFAQDNEENGDFFGTKSPLPPDAQKAEKTEKPEKKPAVDHYDASIKPLPIVITNVEHSAGNIGTTIENPVYHLNGQICLRFTITGATCRPNGEAQVSSKLIITCLETGKTIVDDEFGGKPKLFLGKNMLFGFVSSTIKKEPYVPGKQYHLTYILTDCLTRQKGSFELNFLVAPTDTLTIIKYRAYHDRMCTVQSGLSGFVGQSSWLKIQASGFTGQSYAVGSIEARAIDFDTKIQVHEGSPLKSSTTVMLEKHQKAQDSVLTFMLPFSRSRVGKFIFNILLKDDLSGKTLELQIPFKVIRSWMKV